MDLREAVDKIYVRSVAYLSHAKDDFQSGIATVAAVHLQRDGHLTDYVEVNERSGVLYPWSSPSKEQEELKSMFGDKIAHLDPDHRPQFNEGWPRDPKE